jgi:DNA-binding PadR family transcriptional regulator
MSRFHRESREESMTCRERRFARRGHEEFGRPFGRHRHHWSERGGRGGRVFDHGDLRYVILKLIAEKPRHGYELIKAIEDKLGGAYSPSPGVVYPTLTLLEELGHATVSASEGGKKLYAITADGSAFLAANQATVDAIFSRMAETSAAQGEPAPQILRAMENLRFALRLKLTRGSLSETQVRDIAAILDDAAGRVEQS